VAPRRLRAGEGLEGRPFGNLVYKRTARNFNPMMAMAGKITVAEVEQLVEPGELDPDEIHTPGHLRDTGSSKAEGYEKRIEQRTVRKR
jgi:3-oxoacid CoA-transferase subunit A